MIFHSRYTQAQLDAHEAAKARKARMSVGATPVAVLPAPAVSGAAEPFVRPSEVPPDDPAGEVEPTPATGRSILADVAEAHGLTVAQVVGERRTQRFVRARVEVINRIDRELGWSTSRIAQLLNRDHTTVVHHLDRRGANNPPKWTSDQDAALRAMAADGKTMFQIGDAIGRTHRAVRKRACEALIMMRTPTETLAQFRLRQRERGCAGDRQIELTRIRIAKNKADRLAAVAAYEARKVEDGA